MDNDRRIRFIVPPLFLLASLLWGACVDPAIGWAGLHDLLPEDFLRTLDTVELLGLLAGGGLVLFPLGYIIGTLAYVVLRAIHRGGAGCDRLCRLDFSLVQYNTSYWGQKDQKGPQEEAGS